MYSFDIIDRGTSPLKMEYVNTVVPKLKTIICQNTL